MDEKKKSIWKKIAIAIGSFFTALLTFILCGTINKRRDGLRDNGNRTNDIREQVETAGKLNTSAREHVDKLKDNIGTQRQNIDECQSILADVRKRKVEK